MRRRWATWLGTNVFARTAWNVRGHTCQVTRVKDKFLTEVAMMDESVQMSLVHFIATRRPNRNGWDKEVFALKKAWRSSPLTGQGTSHGSGYTCTVVLLCQSFCLFQMSRCLLQIALMQRCL